MTITLTREPTREDFYAAKDIAEEGCECGDAARLLVEESDALLCKPCRVRKRLNELMGEVDS